MSWIINLSTRAKLILSFGILLLLLSLVILISHQVTQRIRESQQRLFEVNFSQAVDMESLLANINAQRASLLGMLLDTNQTTREQRLQSIRQSSQRNDEIFRRLHAAPWNDATLQVKVTELESLRTAFAQIRDTQIIPSISSGDLAGAQALAMGIQYDRYVSMRTLGDELHARIIEEGKRTLQQSVEMSNRAHRLFLGIGFLAMGFGIFMVLFLNGIIARPLNEVTQMASRLAQGDLSLNLPETSRRDEVGGLRTAVRQMIAVLQQMAHAARQVAEGNLSVMVQAQSDKDVLGQAFATMTSNLRQLTKENREAVQVLASSATEILAATTQVASGAAETATAVNETTTTVEEVKQTAQMASHKARQMSEEAQHAAQVAQNGRKSVQASIEGMQRIQEQMEAMAETVVKLSEQSQAIGEIVAAVTDLAEQSNLLAVNAAIEAARAGEQGKGFAVVAHEIKSLADQSKQATAQVRTILNDIQKAISQSVMATEQSAKTVDAGVRQSAEASEAIRILSETIEAGAQAAMQIAASSQQQSAGMDQVATAMENIKQASHQNVSGTRQAEVAARSLHEIGQRLKELVEKYKV